MTSHISRSFILGRNFIRNLPVILILTQECKNPILLSSKVRLRANEAATVSLRMRKLHELSDKKQVCVVPNQIAKPKCAILGRSCSITKGGLCVSVLLNILDTPITTRKGANSDEPCR